MNRETTLRPMRGADLPAVLGLLEQLGYAMDADELARRSASVAAEQGHHVLVAEAEGRVAGAMHVYARPALEKPPEAIVQSLIVDEAARGAGVGRALLAAAEKWAAERGFTSVALTSQVTREQAHAFYERLGYERVAQSLLMRKRLARP
jgi:ribosomal protein S18 acetylase RimI-like enzyme